jgi:hypothetical protein
VSWLLHMKILNLPLSAGQVLYNSDTLVVAMVWQAWVIIAIVLVWVVIMLRTK